MEALWLKSHDLPHAQIAELVGVKENTLREYFRLYQGGEVAGLKVLNYHRPESELVQRVTSLEAYFREHPPASIKEAQAIIAEITGFERSKTQIREKLRLRYLKVGMIPANANPEIQEKYHQEVMWNPVYTRQKRENDWFLPLILCCPLFRRVVVGGTHLSAPLGQVQRLWKFVKKSVSAPTIMLILSLSLTLFPLV